MACETVADLTMKLHARLTVDGLMFKVQPIADAAPAAGQRALSLILQARHEHR